MRICSLLPSATELVAALGLADHLVARSHECDYPPSILSVPSVVTAALESETLGSEDIDTRVRLALQAGRSLYELDAAKLCDARPDLIITQDLCHVCSLTPHQVEQAIQDLKPRPRLLCLNPRTFDDVLADVIRVGNATHHRQAAKHLITQLRERIARVQVRLTETVSRPRVACIEWMAPLYHAGHWVPDMVRLAGGVDIFSRSGVPSQRLSWKHLHTARPDTVILMPCGFTINCTMRELHALTDSSEWERLGPVQQGRVFVAEAGSYFSRPGPRLVDGIESLAAAFHPDLFSSLDSSVLQPLDLVPHGRR